jgi:hypothetical protein
MTGRLLHRGGAVDGFLRLVLSLDDGCDTIYRRA